MYNFKIHKRNKKIIKREITMTQEEKFKEAKRLYETANADQRYVLERIFPELKESEDEKIRKDLIIYLRSILSNKKYGDKFIESWIAWLEKQGEQKPAFEMITPEESLGIDSDTYNKIVDECIYGEQKPAEWSEEDETVLDNLIYALENDRIGNNRDEYVEYLKSLKDRVQPQWKPSEREKEALLWCVVHLGGADKQTLGELLEELNKL